LKASGGVTYAWRSGDAAMSSTLVTPEKTTTYIVTITDVNGCVLKDTVKLEVVPSIDLQFEYEFITDCFSRPQLLLRNKTIGLADENFMLDFGDGFTSDLPEVIHEYQQDGNYSIRLLGQKEFCVYEKLVTLPLFTFLVPNVITPEGPLGYNDSFTIQYGDKGKTPASAGLKVGVKIFTRWGVKVFESADYQYNWAAKDQDNGVYYVVVSLENQTLCKSWIHVVK
jgi:hypothetical protein